MGARTKLVITLENHKPTKGDTESISTLTHHTPPVSPSSIDLSPVLVSIASAAGYCVLRWTDERMPTTTLLYALSGPAGLMSTCAARVAGFETSKSSSPTTTSLNSFRRMSKGFLRGDVLGFVQGLYFLFIHALFGVSINCLQAILAILITPSAAPRGSKQWTQRVC